MSEKPTIKEYVFCSEGNVVKTRDGRYFAFEETAGNVRIFKTFLLVYYLGIPVLSALCTVLSLFFKMWDNLLFDTLFIWTLAFSVSTYVLYRHLYHSSDFAEVRKASVDYPEVMKLEFSRKRWAFHFSVTALAVVFALANSFSLFCLRSAIEDRAEIVSVEMNETTLLDQGTINPRKLKDQVTNASLVLTAEVIRTPQYIIWALDGRKLNTSLYREFDLRWFWSRDYLVQRCKLYIPLSEICDGSVLEMTCGDLHRRWVFHLAES